MYGLCDAIRTGPLDDALLGFQPTHSRLDSILGFRNIFTWTSKLLHLCWPLSRPQCPFSQYFFLSCSTHYALMLHTLICILWLQFSFYSVILSWYSNKTLMHRKCFHRNWGLSESFWTIETARRALQLDRFERISILFPYLISQCEEYSLFSVANTLYWRSSAWRI